MIFISLSDGVAPGSIVSIFGASLAAAYAAGPPNPLAQAVGDVTVRVDGRFLPLVFVSPGQINAQLPSDLADGDYLMIVKSGLNAEVMARVRVVRNAPGLFATQSGDASYALAAHEDGSAVTADNPAKRGETITIYGTGFGPGDRPSPDGFAAPMAPAVMMADPVDLFVGDTAIKPDWSGLAPGLVGMVATRFKVPDDAPAGAALSLKVRVQSAESNSVTLVLQ